MREKTGWHIILVLIYVALYAFLLLRYRDLSAANYTFMCRSVALHDYSLALSFTSVTHFISLYRFILLFICILFGPFIFIPFRFPPQVTCCFSRMYKYLYEGFSAGVQLNG